MWRWVALVVGIVAISAGGTWFSLSASSGGSSLGGIPFPSAGSKPSGPVGEVSVKPAPIFDFGTMAQEQKDRRTWTISNTGPGDLTLIGDQPYCSCTVLSLKKDEEKVLKPNETFPVEVEWETRENNGNYEKSARIFTSDPKRPEIVFVVKGIVRPAIMVLPGLVAEVHTVMNTEPRVQHFALASADRPQMRVLSATSSRPDLLEVVVKPLTEDEKTNFKVDNGQHLEVTIKPSKSLGDFTEEILVKTDHPLKEEIRLKIVGKIVGPISATPPGLTLSHVNGSKGAKAIHTLWVAGRDEETHFTVASAPKNLKVAIVPADNKGRAGQVSGRGYLMTVTVPPGTPSGVIDEPIVLTTDHPNAAEFRLPVYIQVLGEG